MPKIDRRCCVSFVAVLCVQVHDAWLLATMRTQAALYGDVIYRNTQLHYADIDVIDSCTNLHVERNYECLHPLEPQPHSYPAIARTARPRH